jgi:hypothetical protein
MHQKPGDPWTVDSLANQVGLSRSALAQRFTELIGQPPMQYLPDAWRLTVAAAHAPMARASPPSRNRSATIRKPHSIALSSASSACRRRRGAGRSVRRVLVPLLLAALKYFRRSLELVLNLCHSGVRRNWFLALL